MSDEGTPSWIPRNAGAAFRDDRRFAASVVIGLALLSGCPRTSADVSEQTAPDSAGAAPPAVTPVSGAQEGPRGASGEGDVAGETASTAGASEGRSDPPGMNFKLVPGTTPCKADSDCFPAECCHPSACGETRLDCSATMCTMDCRSGTMDCGGGCTCVEGKCAARILDSIGQE